MKKQILAVILLAVVASGCGSADGNGVRKAPENFEACGSRDVPTDQNLDLVPGKPLTSALLATNPCFNFAWITEEDQQQPPIGPMKRGGRFIRKGTYIINYVPRGTGFPDSLDIEEARRNPMFNLYRHAIDPELNALLESFSLDATQKLIGPHTARFFEKKMAEATKKKKKQPIDDLTLDAIFWTKVQQVAMREGISVQVSDAARERAIADKLSTRQGSLDGYMRVETRMVPNAWEIFIIYDERSADFYEKGDFEKAKSFLKKGYETLKADGHFPKGVLKAQGIIRKYSSKIADQIL